jgi:hypothetical protein
VLIPVGRDLRGLENAAGLAHLVVPVDLDVLEQLQVSRGATEVDASFGTRVREPALGHEKPFLLGVNEFDDVCVGAEMPASPKLGHLGVDHLDALAACGGNPVMTVDDEVGISELVDHDRREGAVAEGTLDALPASDDVGAARMEIAVEVGASAVRADDLVHGDRP